MGSKGGGAVGGGDVGSGSTTRPNRENGKQTMRAMQPHTIKGRVSGSRPEQGYVRWVARPTSLKPRTLKRIADHIVLMHMLNFIPQVTHI